MTFQVGDRVRRVEPTCSPMLYGEVGEEYEVLHINIRGDIRVLPEKPHALSSAFTLVVCKPDRKGYSKWIYEVEKSE